MVELTLIYSPPSLPSILLNSSCLEIGGEQIYIYSKVKEQQMT